MGLYFKSGMRIISAMLRFGAVLAAILLTALPTRAVILYGLDNSANTTDPGTGVPFDRVVGVLNSGGNATASGVYLGGGWVLTAGHVFLETQVKLDNVNYNVVSNSTVYLDSADLKLFQIANAPAASNMILNDDPLADLSAASVFVGWGVGKGTPNGPGSWQWGGASTVAQRWGTNVTLPFTEQLQYTSYQGITYDTEYMFTQFNSDGGDSEFIFTLGDSGGALFQFIGGQWVLSGIGGSVSVNGSSTVGDFSFIVRISTYAGEIQAITGIPEPATGSLLALGLTGWAMARRRRLPFERLK